MQPFVAVGVVKMPVSIDLMFDWFPANATKRFGHSPTGTGNAGISKNIASTTLEHRDIPARALQHAEIDTEFGHRDLGCCGGGSHDSDGTFFCRKQSSRCQPEGGCSNTDGGKEAPPRALRNRL